MPMYISIFIPSSQNSTVMVTNLVNHLIILVLWYCFCLYWFILPLKLNCVLKLSSHTFRFLPTFYNVFIYQWIGIYMSNKSYFLCWFCEVASQGKFRRASASNNHRKGWRRKNRKYGLIPNRGWGGSKGNEVKKAYIFLGG